MSYYSKYIKYFFSSAASLFPDKAIKLFSPRIILPTYHAVTNHTPDHLKYLYKPRTTKEFLKDLELLLKYYKPIDLKELIEITHKKKPAHKNLFHISFDDGLRECYEVIVPVLKAKGIPATFFINPDFIDNKDLMFRYKASLLINEIINNNKHKEYKLIKPIKKCTYPNKSRLEEWAKYLGYNFEEYLLKNKPYMETEQIKQLRAEGFTIGAHSMDHPEFSHIAYEDQIEQTLTSLEYIKKTFQPLYKVFAFPFNDDFITKKYFDTILNYNKNADLTFGVAGIKKDYHPYHLQRIPMEKKFPANSIIKGEYLYYSFKSLLKKNKISRS